MKTYTAGKVSACPCRAREFYRIETNGTGNDLEPIATLKGPDREANAARITATWNACHGLDLPGEVTPGILLEMVRFVHEVGAFIRPDAGAFHHLRAKLVAAVPMNVAPAAVPTV